MSFFYSDDPAADFDRHDAEQNRQLGRLPVCADFDHPIQDETAFYINGEWMCEGCVETYRREAIPE